MSAVFIVLFLELNLVQFCLQLSYNKYLHKIVSYKHVKEILISFTGRIKKIK